MGDTDACLGFRGGPSFWYTGLPVMPGCWSIQDAWSGRSLYTRHGVRSHPWWKRLLLREPLALVWTLPMSRSPPPHLQSCPFHIAKPLHGPLRVLSPYLTACSSDSWGQRLFSPQKSSMHLSHSIISRPLTLAVSFCCAGWARLEQQWAGQLSVEQGHWKWGLGGKAGWPASSSSAAAWWRPRSRIGGVASAGVRAMSEHTHRQPLQRVLHWATWEEFLQTFICLELKDEDAEWIWQWPFAYEYSQSLTWKVAVCFVCAQYFAAS